MFHERQKTVQVVMMMEKIVLATDIPLMASIEWALCATRIFAAIALSNKLSLFLSYV